MQEWEAAFLQYFTACTDKPKTNQIGLEAEHFIVYKQTKETISYYAALGVKTLIGLLMDCYPGAKPIIGEDLLGFITDEFSITLEPAAQVEISIIPKSHVKDIDSIYSHFHQTFSSLLEMKSFELISAPYQPASSVEELRIIPKERYRLMDKHFQQTGSGGRDMMRGTASMQVSIDFYSEDDFRRKIQAAYYYSPLLKLLCDTTTLMSLGDPPQKFLRRTDIWRRVDALRCGILPGIFAENYGFLDYIRFLGNMPPIFTVQGKELQVTGSKTVGELYYNRIPDEKDIEHLLSMAFPDVRLKKYLEIRTADAAPPRYIPAYCALIKGLFYHNNILESAEHEIRRLHLTDKDILTTENSFMNQGWQGSFYGKNAEFAAKDLLAAAKDNLSEEEQSYLNAFDEVIKYHGIANIPLS